MIRFKWFNIINKEKLNYLISKKENIIFTDETKSIYLIKYIINDTRIYAIKLKDIITHRCYSLRLTLGNNLEFYSLISKHDLMVLRKRIKRELNIDNYNKIILKDNEVILISSPRDYYNCLYKRELPLIHQIKQTL